VTAAQRQELETRLEGEARAARSLFDRHRPDRLAARPESGGWSAVECLAHLNLTSAAMLPLIEAAIADLGARGARGGASRMDMMGRLLRWVLEPRRFRSKTRPSFEPPPALDAAAVLEEFVGWHNRAIAALRSAEGLDLTAARIASPFDSRVRYNVFAAFNILETHQRRHLDQAARAVETQA